VNVSTSRSPANGASAWDEVNYLELFQQIGMIPAFGLGDTQSAT
jgi:hypothetical protein